MPKTKPNQQSLRDSFRITKRNETAKEVVQDSAPAIKDIKIQEAVAPATTPDKKQPPQGSRPALDTTDPKYKSYLNSILADEISEPIHPSGDPVEQILKHFDFESDYGPVAGLSRLERWNRAQKLGKSPPQIIKEVLETEQGHSDPRYSQSYLYQHV